MNRKIKGFFFGAIAEATYGMNPLFTLPLYAENLTADTVLFYRYIFAAAMIGILMKLRRESFALRVNEIIPLFLGGMLFSVSSLFLFLSYRHMDAGIASTLLFVYPLMVAVIMAVFFKERLTKIKLCSILTALTGIGLLYQGGEGGHLSLYGVLLVMFSSLAFAIYLVGVNKSLLQNMPSLKLTFYVLLFGVLIYIVRLKFCVELQVLPSWRSWSCILALAFFPTVISLAFTTLSIRYVGATITAVLGALEPVTAVFFGVLVFREQLTPRLLVGMFLVISAVSLILAGDTVSERFRAKLRNANN